MNTNEIYNKYKNKELADTTDLAEVIQEISKFVRDNKGKLPQVIENVIMREFNIITLSAIDDN